MPRLPQYLKRNIIDTEESKNVRKILKENSLNTVCDGARCPNKNECYKKNTATFLIMGSVCTRNCRYCNIACEKPEPLDLDEPKHIAKAVKELGLKYVVITSVTRDDLPDGGAEHFAKCIEEIKRKEKREKENEFPNTSLRDIEVSAPTINIHRSNLPQVEILTPDFKGKTSSLDTIINSFTPPPDVFNHNIETVERLFKIARPQANYRRSLEVLKYVKDNSNITTKSGLMVGLGETFEEIEQTLIDLKNVGCDIVTIGQYIPPTKSHLPLGKFYTLEEFEELKVLAKKVGIRNYQIGPLVRSSYNAAETASCC